ncbi:retrotransposon-derived protein PEG10-like, partial [Trifolium medium]|nr:retrotransposon-derived protein PEG10-like [Trifolium medium]
SNNNRAPEERWRKLSIPVFEDVDAYGWVNRVEHYFELKGVLEEEKMQAAMVAMEGKALSWFQWWEYASPNPTW